MELSKVTTISFALAKSDCRLRLPIRSSCKKEVVSPALFFRESCSGQRNSGIPLFCSSKKYFGKCNARLFIRAIHCGEIQGLEGGGGGRGGRNKVYFWKTGNDDGDNGENEISYNFCWALAHYFNSLLSDAVRINFLNSCCINREDLVNLALNILRLQFATAFFTGALLISAVLSENPAHALGPVSDGQEEVAKAALQSNSEIVPVSFESMAIEPVPVKDVEVIPEKGPTIEQPVPVYEIKDGKWTQYVSDDSDSAFVKIEKKFDENGKELPQTSEKRSFDLKESYETAIASTKNLLYQIFLPAGFPNSVSSDYLEYTKWKLAQTAISQAMNVFATQSMLRAAGLGMGVIPTAVALSWALKEGVGSFSNVALSKLSKNFEVSPKGWRFVADAVENTACGLQILTVLFPGSFLGLGSTAAVGLSAAGLVQAATKTCFFASFSSRSNLAEVVAKGDAQGILAKCVGISAGILLSSKIRQNVPWLLSAYCAMTACHLYFNLMTYRTVQLKTLNPYRASLVLTEYIESGRVPSLKEVNEDEPLFENWPSLRHRKPKRTYAKKLSKRTKQMAKSLRTWINLGAPLGSLVANYTELLALTRLYSGENFLLSSNNGKLQIVLRSSATPRDMLRAMIQAVHYNFVQSEVSVVKGSILQECSKGGALRVSRDFVVSNFDAVCAELESHGWNTDGLVAQPGKNRLVSAPPVVGGEKPE